ncbi:MAG: type II toxin-antitoxin system VapC family toxin [Gammaproteobacteria bacterium]|nr:type II toxin-antitoxin system VapC family toxin [Gammaproteobacteria bacterium]
MKFWDSSALLPLVVSEPTTSSARASLAADPVMIVWWGTRIECASALARLERDGALDAGGAARAFDNLATLADVWHEIDASDMLRECAGRLLRVHPLRAADSVQLAAAVVAAEMRPTTLEFVTADRRLADAARKEGFTLVALV